MEPIADITGFDIDVNVSSDTGTATVRVASGIAYWPPGMTRLVPAASTTVQCGATARTVRVFLCAQPAMFDFQKRYYADTDGDQDARRGCYSNGLIVVGHVEIPALSQTLSAHSPLERAEQLRRDASRKPRKPRRPKLDAWLDKQDLNATAEELFTWLPSADSDDDLYRDGDTVVEVHRDRELSPLSYGSFANAVSRARRRSRLIKNHG